METADYVSSGRFIAEDEYGSLFAPSRTREGWWDERLNLRRPRHFYYWLRSRILHRVVMVESVR